MNPPTGCGPQRSSGLPSSTYDNRSLPKREPSKSASRNAAVSQCAAERLSNPEKEVPDSKGLDKKRFNLTCLGQYDKAIEIASAELEKKFDAANCKDLGFRYSDAGYHHKAIETFKRIPGWQNESGIVQAIAILLSKIGDSDGAIELLQSFDNWNKNSSILCTLAMIYEQLKQNDNARATYKSIPLLYKDAQITISFGRFLEEIGDYDEALEVYKRIEEINPPLAMQNMARCYERMGDYKNAEETFERLVKGYPRPHFFIPFARYYQARREFAKAIATFKRAEDWKNNTKILMGIACCYEVWEKYDLAIEHFQMIRNWETNFPAVLSYGRCYERNMDWVNAEKAYKIVDGWVHNPSAVMCLARLVQRKHEKMGQLKEYYYEVACYYQMLPNWEKNRKALNGLIWLYIRCEDYRKAQEHLDMALACFPDSVEFFKLQGLWYSLRNHYYEGIAFLLEAIKKFPDDTSLALRLIEFYIKSNQRNSAELLRDNYIERIPYDKKFLSESKKLFESKHKDSSPLKWNYVKLPQVISDVFRMLGEDKEVFLVGSTVLDLLLNDGTYNPHQDFDFSTNDPALGQALQSVGFSPIHFIPGLYRKYPEKGVAEIDLMLSKLNVEGELEPWINFDVNRRDFTICALFCDKKGTVFDPTGRGIQDAKKRVLATVVDPVLCFQHDVIGVFRGLKYELRGFKPTREVAEAIRKWEPNVQTIVELLPHMAAVLRKLIRANPKVLELLENYGLKSKLKKLFEAHGMENVTKLFVKEQKQMNYLRATTRSITPIRYTETVFVPKAK